MGGKSQNVKTSPQMSTSTSCFNVLLILLVPFWGPMRCHAFTEVIVDSAGNVGEFADLVLGVGDLPVISYFDRTNEDIKMARCWTPTCSITHIETIFSGVSLQHTAIALQANGFPGAPVVAYSKNDTNAQFMLHWCTDVNCTVTNGDVVLDGIAPALSADVLMGASDFPYVAYESDNPTSSNDLRIIHCNAESCAGMTNTMIASRGTAPSIQENGSGTIVVAYWDPVTYNTMLCVCADTDCTVLTVHQVESTFNTGAYLSMVLINDKPVISKWESQNAFLEVIYCGSEDCNTTVASNTVVLVDDGEGSTAQVGQYNKIALDSASRPIVLYYEYGVTKRTRIARCLTQNCSSVTITQFRDGVIDPFPGLALDAQDFPVISVYTETQDLAVIRCDNSECSSTTNMPTAAPSMTPTSGPTQSPTSSPTFAMTSTVTVASNNLGALTSVALDSMNRPIIAFHDTAATSLELLFCGNEDCSGMMMNSRVTVDDGGAVNDVGQYCSLRLMPLGDQVPVIAYHDASAGSLLVSRCLDTSCSAKNTTVVDPGGGNTVGLYNSLAIAGCPFKKRRKRQCGGTPVISYRDATAGALKVAICASLDCSSGPTIVVLDQPGQAGTGQFSSLALTFDNKPSVAYYAPTSDTLKYAQCSTTSCTSPSIRTIAGVTGGNHVALAFDNTASPMIAYYSSNQSSLRFTYCNNADCSDTNAEVVLDTGVVGLDSIAIGLRNSQRPSVAYWDSANENLKVATCFDNQCISAPDVLTVDPTFQVGKGASLALNSAQFPVISYLGYGVASDLIVTRCIDESCAGPTPSPTSLPTSSPTSVPSQTPTFAPTSSPSSAPSSAPSQTPTSSPTSLPTSSPSSAPSQTPTFAPTMHPTVTPGQPTRAPSSRSPSSTPSVSPTAVPSQSPSISPTQTPSASPTRSPSTLPTAAPTQSPSSWPTQAPTLVPTRLPSVAPTVLQPRAAPSTRPTVTPGGPTRTPTSGASGSAGPTSHPTVLPGSPTKTPTTRNPTNAPPTAAPSVMPSDSPATNSPSVAPSVAPGSPTAAPTTKTPTAAPTQSPTQTPSVAPSVAPGSPTAAPTTKTPTAAPTQSPTQTPSVAPSVAPGSPTAAPTTKIPTAAPTQSPTQTPSVAPSVAPGSPTAAPTTKTPTAAPTQSPTQTPSAAPSESPSSVAPSSASPSVSPTSSPSRAPSSANPTVTPGQPTMAPTQRPTTAAPTGTLPVLTEGPANNTVVGPNIVVSETLEIEPGAQLTVVGSVTFVSRSVLQFSFATNETSPTSNLVSSKPIQVTGDATLGGTLVLRLDFKPPLKHPSLNSFEPVIITLIEGATSISGQFSDYNVTFGGVNDTLGECEELLVEPVTTTQQGVFSVAISTINTCAGNARRLGAGALAGISLSAIAVGAGVAVGVFLINRRAVLQYTARLTQQMAERREDELVAMRDTLQRQVY